MSKHQVVVVHSRGRKLEVLGTLAIIASVIMFAMCTEDAGKHDLATEAGLVGIVGLVVFVIGRFRA